MTYSIVAKCARTGQYGIGVSTYSPRSGATVPFVVPNRGALAFQCTTSQDLRAFAGELLAKGASADGILREVERVDRFWQKRQIAIVDTSGHVAAFTGAQAPATAEHRLGVGYAVAGNVVTTTCVSDTTEGFEAVRNSDLPLAEKLMRALEAGARSGGQEEGLTSAALLVYDRYSFPIVDLRVDVHPTPVIELRRIWEFYQPLTDYYTRRNIDPSNLGRWWQYRMEVCPGWKPVHMSGRIPQQ